MGAALRRVNVVGKGVDIFLIRIVVLEGHFYGGALHDALDVDRLFEQDFFVLVQVLDELDNAALVMENPLRDGIGALIGKGDADALVQEGHFPQTGLKDVVLEIARLKHAVRDCSRPGCPARTEWWCRYGQSRPMTFRSYSTLPRAYSC